MDMTSTAQAAGVLIQAAGDPTMLVTAVICALVGWLSGRPQQEMIEHALADKGWMPQGLKPFLPTICSTLAAAAASVLTGVPIKAALWGALTGIVSTHRINATDPDAAVADSTPPILEKNLGMLLMSGPSATAPSTAFAPLPVPAPAPRA